ncbi:hypothetical protein [Streptomyces rochei]|uniref:hypothetical protein n=1 Tax=Streptomyces rochei TaxID=1928 RepID=UPI0033BA1FA2
MAALGKITVRCPGCKEDLKLSLIVDEEATPAPGELVLKPDLRSMDQHIATAHAEVKPDDG